MELSDLHEKCIYPAVRINTGKAGGSGTIIYSMPKNGESGQVYDTFVLTNHHVVEDAITTKKDWDSLLKKQIEKEFIREVQVEVFDYVDLSRVVSANTHQGEVVAYDQYHDLAIVKLISPRPARHIATFLPKESIKDEILIGKDVIAVGCSILHDPVVSYGKITGVREMIDNKRYLMTSTHIIFGNSGGAMYTNDGFLIGVPSRVTVYPMGMSSDIITWMSFPCHPERLYEFIDQQEFQFLYKHNESFEAALARRDKKQKDAMRELLMGHAPDPGVQLPQWNQ